MRGVESRHRSWLGDLWSYRRFALDRTVFIVAIALVGLALGWAAANSDQGDSVVLPLVLGLGWAVLAAGLLVAWARWYASRSDDTRGKL